MSTINQDIIKGLKRSIKVAEAKAEEPKKPSQKSSVQMRSAEREFWRKKIKGYQKELKELEDECKTVD